MRGGRLKIINESRYSTEEVERLVRFGLDEVDVKGEKILALVTNARKHSYRGWGGARSCFVNDRGMRAFWLAKAHNAGFVVHVIIGAPERFPINPYKRNGQLHDYKTWQEALVGVTAHEGMHVQHSYDGSYEDVTYLPRARYWTGKYRRVGDQRVEPKCAAFEARMVRRFREEVAQPTPYAEGEAAVLVASAKL